MESDGPPGKLSIPYSGGRWHNMFIRFTFLHLTSRLWGKEVEMFTIFIILIFLAIAGLLMSGMTGWIWR